MSGFSGMTLDTTSFGQAIRRLSAINNKTQAENLLRYAKTTLSNPGQGSGLLQITPPASAGSTGTAAKRAGESAIAKDLAAIFTPVRLKYKRPEIYPNVSEIHRRLFLTKVAGRTLRSDKGRGSYYVDGAKLKALALALKKNVGKLASGWAAAANRLGVAVPAWIARHGGGRGQIRVALTAPRYEVEMTCICPPNAPSAELERRVPYAIKYATARAEREIAFLLARDAGKAGFKASA